MPDHAQYAMKRVSSDNGLIMNEVLKALRPVKSRIRRNRLLRGSAAGLAAGLAAAVILQAAAFFTPIPDRGLWSAAAVAVAILLIALGNAVRPVKNPTAARAADACGLKERAVTALEGTDEPIRQLQRRDACEALKKLDVKQIRPDSAKKELLAALCCAVLLVCLLMIPNAQDSKAAAQKALSKTLQEGRETVEQAAEKDAERLPDEKKSELRKITADLNRELAESRDAADALVALDRAEQRLEQMREKTAGDASNAAAEGRNGSGDQAEETQGNASGESTSQTSGTQAAEAAAASAGTAVQLQTLEALAALKGAVNPSMQCSAVMTTEGTAGMQAEQSGAGAGNSGSQDGQNGNGAGGSGSDGKTGGGAGEGNTNEEQQGGGNGNGAIVKGSRDPRYKEASYETIYDPEHIDKNKQNELTEQYRMGDEGSVQIETGPGRGNLNGDVPWGDILQDYADTEARAADRENLTMQEKQWVNEYYRLLTEQK